MTPDASQLAKFERYRTEVLFLLVGGNPLPNYVAAQLMAKQDADIFLLATQGTVAVAQRLKTKLQQVMSQAHVQAYTIPEVGGFEIESALGAILEKEKARIGGRQLGLNYTGGTKEMAVHVYDRIQGKYPEGIFSYLDAHSLRMIISVQAQPTQRPSVALAVEPTLQDVWELHGLAPDTSKPEPTQTPRLKEIVQSIAQIHSTAAGFREWRRWLSALRSEEIVPTKDKYEELQPFIAQLAVVGGTAQPTAAQVAALFGRPTLRQCDFFLRGQWLEEWTLWSLFPACQRQNLKHWTKGLHLKQDPNARSEKDAPPSFELDVVALRGHQLFLFSCIATEGMERTTDNPAAGDRSEAKKHLFEAYMRARQVGGDEARVALVSCVARPDTLKAEVVHEWDAEGKIEVFGREHLETLSTHIGAWFSKANQQ